MERKLVYVSVTLGVGDGQGEAGARDFSAEGMTSAIDRVLHFSGLGWIDMAVLQEPGETELAQSSLAALKALRKTGRIRLLGIAGGGSVMDAYVSTGAFDALLTPLDINVGWPIRNRIRSAREQDMAVFAYDVFIDRRTRQPRRAGVQEGAFGLGGGRRAAETPKTDAFGFLYRTPNWTAEAICLSLRPDRSVGVQRDRGTDGHRPAGRAGRSARTRHAAGSWRPRSRWRALRPAPPDSLARKAGGSSRTP